MLALLQALQFVVLLTAQLQAKKLMWKFADADGEPFSARMSDPDYLAALKTGRTGTELKIGIIMDVDIEISQETTDGVWIARGREIVKVYSPLATTAPADDGGFPFDEPRKPPN